MRIFASWSGEASKEIAELLKTWIPQVIQDVDVYVSSQDIGKGERWLTSVGNSLAEIDFGLIVVTKANITAPWILFEAGALSKSVKGVVIPLLCGIDSIEAAASPLTQFQYARVLESEMRDVLLQINSLSAKPLDQPRLEKSFSKWWPEFAEAYGHIELPDDKPPKKESETIRLSHIEDAVGSLMNDMRRVRRMLESQHSRISPPEIPTLDNNPFASDVDQARAAEIEKVRANREFLRRRLRHRINAGEVAEED